MASKLFVGNLDLATTREEVQALFAEAGAIRDVFLPIDRATNRPRGFAFVEYESEAEANSAIERFNGHELGGRELRVNVAVERPAGGRPDRPSFAGGGGPRFGGGGGGGGFPSGKSKGSRRNLRAKKRGL